MPQAPSHKPKFYIVHNIIPTTNTSYLFVRNIICIQSITVSSAW
jgi:hypothetical protein